MIQLLIAIGVFFAVGQQQPADDRYRIGPGDVIDIRIYNRPQLSRDGVRVEGNGMIRMPLIETARHTTTSARW